jgi:plastocyanin
MRMLVFIMVLGLLLAGCAQTGGTGTGGNGAQSGNISPLAGNVSGAGSGSGTAKTVEVNIQGFAFNPAEVTVKQGDTVKWTNGDSVPHTVKASGFVSGTLGQGETYSHTFSEAPGEYAYSCGIHTSMHGKVTVTK